MIPHIISAACKAVVNGEENVFKVHRHADFYLWMHQLHCSYDKSKVEQGFVLLDGYEEKFVNRHEAGQIAFAARQTEKLLDTLFSEDLY